MDNADKLNLLKDYLKTKKDTNLVLIKLVLRPYSTTSDGLIRINLNLVNEDNAHNMHSYFEYLSRFGIVDLAFDVNIDNWLQTLKAISQVIKQDFQLNAKFIHPKWDSEVDALIKKGFKTQNEQEMKLITSQLNELLTQIDENWKQLQHQNTYYNRILNFKH